MADSENQKRVKTGEEMKQGFSWLNADFIHRWLSRRLSLTYIITNQSFFLFVFNLSLFGDKITSVIVLFRFISLSLKNPKEGVASHPIYPPSLPGP